MKEQIDSFSGYFSFLSNFAGVPIEYEGLQFCSVEHAYQAAKTLDLSERKKIQTAIHPGTAKKLGRTLTIRKDWHDIKLAVMEELLNQKFSDSYFKECLLITENVELIEGNTWGDTFWGVCNGKGQNHLGKLLMKIRSKLQEKSNEN
jgi:ribA/ribD-fused uncharacterized protein